MVRLLERLAVRAADRVVVTSSASADYLVTQHGLDRRRVRVVPNYVDTDLFAPDPNVCREKDLAVSVGRLSPEKGLPTLVDAAGRVPSLRLRLVGDGAEREALARRAAAAGVQVEFTGTVPNAALPRLLREASVFVLPSLYEGHPKALLEAMACGLPVIGSDVPGIAEVIRHRENGWLCRPGDPVGLADALATLVTDEALRTRLGAQARADVERHYSVGAVLARELEVIRELVG
jgi:glycosyltransferase involved in cell wall biosynthesis